MGMLILIAGMCCGGWQEQPTPTAEADTILMTLLADVNQASTIDEARGAWDAFAVQIEVFRAQGIPYNNDSFDFKYFRVPWYQYQLFRNSDPTSMDLATLYAAEPFLRQFVSQFQWDPAFIPAHLHVTREDHASVYELGRLLWHKGHLLEDAGSPNQAKVAWEEARGFLHDNIERILGHGFGDAPEEAIDGDIPFLTNITALYLRLVMLLDGPDAYVQAAGQAFAWLPHESHEVVTQMRELADQWSDHRAHLQEASSLFALVRQAHAEWWDDQYRLLADNMLAYYGGIDAAIELGNLEEAARLLEEFRALVQEMAPGELRDMFERWEDSLTLRLRQAAQAQAAAQIIESIVSLDDHQDDAVVPNPLASADEPGPAPHVRPGPARNRGASRPAPAPPSAPAAPQEEPTPDPSEAPLWPIALALAAAAVLGVLWTRSRRIA